MSAQTLRSVDDRIRRLIVNRRPGWSLEQPFYTAPDIFALDLERVFRRCWLFAGHANRIPNPGDYFTHALANDSLILIRDDDGQIHALFNTCRHRGSLICLEPSGHARKLVCPYHQWVYEKNGALASAKMMPDDLDKSAFGLHRAHVRVVEGLIFIHLGENADNFDAIEAAIRGHLAPYELEHAKICHTQRYLVRANWKIMEENFRECYHCPVGHPEYCHAVLGFNESPEQIASVSRERREHWRQLGLSTLDIPFSPENGFHCSRYPLRPGFVSESLDGQPVAPVLGRLPEPDAGILAIVMFPNFWFEASGDYACSMRRTPLSPTLCEVEATWLVRGDAVEGVDYDVDRVIAFWKRTGEQDWTLCENNQAGVNSSRYRPGPYAPIESGPETFVQWYLNRLCS
ncbi:MAG TPA: aromatic ring-hydroxylating dioxygenase subunit alpha [Chthonomonadaceae bacterium]|nr:aromatic ring-hydroxylating dioxygenase subunit alpha [Chthonomonadaceae bacterium]